MPLFHSLLIANRGEIALRIMRTAARLGYRSIAVYSDADRDALHRAAADLALPIGAAAPAASYLNGAALLQAARQSGAQAVHPGYGFLAEQAGFADACVAAGLVWVGPPAAAMRAMGNKAEAKRLMAAAGVPCVPGYQGADQSDARLLAEAENIGYPVMIKAAAGGGGRGMRLVGQASGFPDALRSARSEAQHAFDSAELILEKAIVAPRHIEIQVFADCHGHVVHLGERDCSVQRRHQKLIEESPSPAVGAALRASMGEVAVAAARAIGYVGAGTLEFLLDRDGGFYFMEMNTRLQVEHAVTEALLGIDLVEWQLRIASGEALPLTQAELDARRASGGHAIEVRLCAEDPQQDFLPHSGTVARWRAPQQARCDHALADGATVSPHYDSMLAKIVAHGRDRADALRRLRAALAECVLLGVQHNRRFLAACVAHPAFARGEFSTAFIEDFFPAQARTAAPPDGQLIRLSAALLAWQRNQARRARYPAELGGWSSGRHYAQQLRFELDGVSQSCRVAAWPDGVWEVGQGDASVRVQLCAQGAHGAQQLSVIVDGIAQKIDYAIDTASAATLYFRNDGAEHSLLDLSDAPATRNGGGAGNGRIAAPMNGRVVALPVATNAAVKAGQVLLVVEAMKMEHSILAPRDGVVQAVYTSLGEQVAPGTVLLELATG